MGIKPKPFGDCGNPHNDWKEEADKLAEDLKDI